MNITWGGGGSTHLDTALHSLLYIVKLSCLCALDIQYFKCPSASSLAHDMTCSCVYEPCCAVLWCQDECWHISTNFEVPPPPPRAFMDDLYLAHIRFFEKNPSKIYPLKIINHYGLFYTYSKLHLSWDFNTGIYIFCNWNFDYYWKYFYTFLWKLLSKVRSIIFCQKPVLHCRSEHTLQIKLTTMI